MTVLTRSVTVVREDVMRILAITVVFAGVCSLIPAVLPAIECGDCGIECGSALSCMNQVPGTPCGMNGICIDLNHPACGLEIRCCGCEEGISQQVLFDPPLAIPDGDPVGITSSIDVLTSRIVVDLDIYLEINHSWVGDLVVTLTHKATTATLIHRPGDPATPGGCDSDLSCEKRIYLNDQAAVSIECSPDDCETCFPGGQVQDYSYIPNEALTAFNGHDAFGEWEIAVADLNGGDVGEICSWGIIVVGAGPVPAETLSWSTVKAFYR